MRYVFAIVLSIVTCSVFAQSGAAKRALKALQEGDMEKAQKNILKGLEKDTLDPLLHYDIAIYQLQLKPANIDSANFLERTSRNRWEGLSVDERPKYEKNEFSISNIDVLRSRIDSLGFQRSLGVNTEDGYKRFLKDFPDAEQTAEAIRLRDSVAYATASTENTYEAYLAFMDKYPSAVQYAEARQRYDRLLFEVSTRKGTLQSLEKFLRDYPNTPYRAVVESDIFEFRTATASTESFQKFIRDYPTGKAAKDAKNFQYYIVRQEKGKLTVSDSIARMHFVNAPMWVAVFDTEKVTFLDGSGDDKFSIERTELSEQYKCYPLTEDLIVGTSSLMTRTGEIVYSGKFDEIEIYESGLVRIGNRGRYGMITTWGRDVLPLAFAEIRELENKLLIARKGRGFAIYSLAGRALTSSSFDDVSLTDGILQLKKGSNVALTTLERLANDAADRVESDLTYYDEVEFLGDGRIWVRNGQSEGILDGELKPLLPVEARTLTITPAAYISQTIDEVTLRSTDLYQKYTTGESIIEFNDRYVRFTSEESEGLFDLGTFRFIAFPDSINLAGRDMAITYGESGVKIYARSETPVPLPASFRSSRILRYENTNQLLVQTSQGFSMINDNTLVKVPNHTDIAMVNDSLFVLTTNGKKGLWNLSSGKYELQPRYDGIANFDGRDVSIFRNRKFGLYRVTNGFAMTPEYEKIVDPFGDSLFTVVKDGKKGIVDESNEFIIPAEYSDINYWTDTIALVKTGENWQMYNMNRGTISSDQLSSIRVLSENQEERFLMAMIEEKFGIFSSAKGEVIPATFDDILNVGTDEDPVFFTETYVDAADLHVIIYFDSAGNLLRRQAVNPDLFYEIYCED